MKKFNKIIFLILTVFIFSINIFGNSSGESKLFLQNQIGNIYVTIDESSLEAMYGDPLAEKYYKADVKINGQTLKRVAIRTKGNSSLKSVANMDTTRYSFKIDFNKYVKGQNIENITKINLNNNFSDPSYMKEYLTYYLMDYIGLKTPQISYVNLYINGELHGLYTVVENIDEQYIENNYDYKYGDLFKPEGTGSDLKYISDSLSDYTGVDLKTDIKNTTEDDFINFVKAVNNNENLEEYFDIDTFLRYMAVSTFVVNLDSYQGGITHNYYLYNNNGVFEFIGWDYNMSFNGFTAGINTQQAIDFMIDEPVLSSLDSRPLVKAVFSNENYLEIYHSYIKELLDGPLQPDNFAEKTEEVKNLIEESVKNDPTAFYTYDEFINYIYTGLSDSEDQAAEMPAPVQTENTDTNTGALAADNNKRPTPPDFQNNNMNNPMNLSEEDMQKVKASGIALPGEENFDPQKFNEALQKLGIEISQPGHPGQPGQPDQQNRNFENKAGGGMEAGNRLGLIPFMQQRYEAVKNQIEGNAVSKSDGSGNGGSDMNFNGPGDMNKK